MYENSTLNDVLAYVYDDCSQAQAQQLESQLAKDDRLYYATAEVMALTRKLNHVLLEPKQATLDSIMAYAKAKAVVGE